MSEPDTMLGLMEPLQKTVTEKFGAAYKAKDILFSDTTLAHLRLREGASVSAALYLPSADEDAHSFRVVQVPIAILSCSGQEA